jgi:phage gpG-like protein
MKSGERDFKQMINDLHHAEAKGAKLFQGTMQRIVKTEALNLFEESWDTQGFNDAGVSKWKKRKEPSQKFKKNGKERKGFKKWKAKDKGRAILVSHRSDTKGGHLKDSLRGEISGLRVFIYTDKKYAQIHNEGGRAGRNKNARIPQRKFMGSSRTLDERIGGKADKLIDNLL